MERLARWQPRRTGARRIALVTVACALALPAAAAATPTASIDGNVIKISDDVGAADNVSISPAGTDSDGRVWHIRGVTPGAGCTPASGGAFCSDGRFSGTTRSFQITLAGGADTLDYGVSSSDSGNQPQGTIDMGAGNDTVTSSAVAAHTILGGADTDTITLTGSAPSSPGSPSSGAAPDPVTIDGGTEDDTIDVSGRRSGDTINGGAGIDTVTYASRLSSTPVTVTLDDVANDGRQFTSSNEGDNVHSDVENVTGTPGGDRLTGSALQNKLSGLAGADTIVGGDGDDTLLGGPGADILGPPAPNPIVFCFTTFTGQRFCNSFLFITAPPPDGRDTVDGGTEDDRINVVDGFADAAVQCGGGTNDLADIDLLDPAPLAGCETIGRGARDQHPLVQIHGIRPGARGTGRVRVLLACGRTHSRSCRGTLTLRKGRRAVARARYRIGPRKARVVTLRLSGSARRAAERRHGVVLVARARERDENGQPLTTETRVRVRLA